MPSAAGLPATLLARAQLRITNTGDGWELCLPGSWEMKQTLSVQSFA